MNLLLYSYTLIYHFIFLLDFMNNHTVTDGIFITPKELNVQTLNPKVLPHKSNLRQSQSYNKFPGQRNSHDPR